MPIRYVLFDLDGTLLPMDQEVFLKAYFGGLAKKLVPLGYDGETLFKAIWAGTGAMIKNDGSALNETLFWNTMHSVYGDKIRDAIPYFEEFYQQDFDKVQQVCGFNPKAAETVRSLKQQGYTVALATQPAFPAAATERRIRWAGLEPSDFAVYTTFENSRYCKPKEEYYLDVAQSIGADPRECLMVGNDISDDMPAAKVGMQVFLLTDCLIAKEGEDPSAYPNGSFDELMEYIRSQSTSF